MISSPGLANRYDQAPDHSAAHRAAAAGAPVCPAGAVADRVFLPADQPRRRGHPGCVDTVDRRRKALCRGPRREPAADLRHPRPAGPDGEDPARNGGLLVHGLGGRRHLRLLLGVPPPRASRALGGPCAHRGPAAPGAAVLVLGAAQRAFRPARTHHVRGLRALPDCLDGTCRRGEPDPNGQHRGWHRRRHSARDEAALSRHSGSGGTLSADTPGLARHADRSHSLGDRPAGGGASRVDVHAVPRLRPVRPAARHRILRPDRRVRAGARC